MDGAMAVALTVLVFNVAVSFPLAWQNPDCSWIEREPAGSPCSAGRSERSSSHQRAACRRATTSTVSRFFRRRHRDAGDPHVDRAQVGAAGEIERLPVV